GFFFNSYNKFINLSLPNWNIENVSLNGVNHSDAYLYNEPFGQLLTLFNAQNGTWNVICNSSNFLTNVSVIRNDIFIDLVNATDIVNISCNFSTIINTGLANATIYPLYDANYSTSKSVSGSNSLVFYECDINQTLIQNVINYTVQVFWYNGTEVGLNKTKLDILSLASNISLIYNSTDVNAGEYAYAYFNFTDNETGNTILNAEYELKNSTDGSIWTKSYTLSYYSNGTYRIRLSTVGLESAIFHNVTIFVWGRVHDNSTLNITFRIYGGATNVSILSGLVEEGIYQVITSNLYVNATVSFRIHYQTNDSAYPIEDAFVEAEDWVGVPLTYSDLGGGDYEVFIHSTNLHVNNYTMTFIIQAIGYDSAKLQIKVPVLEIPTQIDVPPEYQNLEKYSDEQFDVIIIYYDSYHYESIEDAVPEDGGNVTYQLLSNNETMDRITSLAGLYKATIKLSEISGIQENTYYNISIAAKAIDFQLAQANISIFIKPKINTSLNLINPPIQVLAGNELKLHANLTLQDGTPIPNVIVTFQINYSQSGISEKVEYTNQSGIATVEITPEKINDNFTILLMYSGNISYNEVNSSNYFIDIIILASNICLLVPSEIMAGDEFEICANLTLVDGTPIKNELVIFAVTSNPGGTINYQVYTNGSGIAILDISTYQGLDNLSIQVLYEGNETINAVNSLVENVMVIFYQSILSVDVINEILEGQTLEIIIYLKFLANNSPIIGEQVQCNLVFGGLGTSNIYYGTISPDGYALIRVLVPIGARSISINVTYSGKSHISTATLPTIIQVNVITILDIIIRYSPIWIPLIIAAIAIPLTIKYGIMRPRYKKKLSKWKLTESKFTDLANLEFLLVNIRENGLNIFNYSFQGSEINFELLGGFFTAITMFQRELMLDDKKDVQKSDHFELNYQNFKIYVKNYEEVMCVLITSQNPSEDVKVASNMFIKTFYKQFQDNVKSFDGNLKIFQTANEHVEQYFELQLTYPHIVNPLFKGRVRRLNNLEMVIYRAATAIFVQNRYFFIPTLIEMVESVRKEPRSQLLHTLYQMRLDKIFEPISFDEAHRILSEEKEQVSTLKKIDDALGEIK
ncbi:MAG: hypothetical protein EAX96_17625, partial [Candidatus Lokiarchaeota archaeon]|nr:hypothetical protein [Candidatus Lokiarchaeota archaeon]